MATKKEADVPQTKKKAAVGAQKVNKSRLSGVIESGQPVLDDDSVSLPNVDGNSQVSQQTYKYIIQATVLYNSWPLTESQLAFVQTLKDLEKNDLREEPKVIIKKKKGNPVPESAHSEKHEELISMGFSDAHGSTDGQKTTPTAKTTRKGKDKGADKAEKEKAAKEKVAPKVEPQAQQQDPNKPYWVLRLVTEQIETDILEVKKDTERTNEIRAMKQAWESAEPGRSIKAAQARLQFINKFSKKSEAEAEPKDMTKILEEGETRKLPGVEAIPSAVTTNTTVSPVKKELEPLDITPYFQQTIDEPILYNEILAQHQETQKAEEVHRFRQYREGILSKRNDDYLARKRLKAKVLDTYGDIRASLQETLDIVLLPRELYREKLLEEERQQQEAMAAEETALKQEQEKKSPDHPKKKGKGGKKK